MMFETLDVGPGFPYVPLTLSVQNQQTYLNFVLLSYLILLIF